MRVLQIVHTSMQFEPPVVALGTLLAERGHTVACSGYWLPGLEVEEAVADNYWVARIARGDYSQLPRFLRGALRLVRFWHGVIRLHERLRPEAIIAYSYETLPLAWGLARAAGASLVYYSTEYSTRPGWREYAIGWGIPKAVEGWFVRRCDWVISVEKNRALLQAQQWGRPVDQILLNSPRTDSAHSVLAQGAIADRPAGGAVRCVYAGRIGRHNCMEALFSRAEGMQDVFIDFFGPIDSGFAEEWRTLLANSAPVAQGRFRYRETLSYEALKTVLMEYDVGLVLYDDRLENTRLASPAKIFEYMRNGLAVISTSQPTPASVIREAECGCVVRPPDLEGFVEAVHILRQEPEKLKAMRRRALAAFQARYAYDEGAKPLVHFLERGEPSTRC